MSERIRVASISEIPNGKSKTFLVGTTSIAIFNLSEKFYAIEDACSHAGAPLSEGTINGNVVACPWHGATFDITNGKALSEPATDNLQSYKVIAQDTDLFIEK